MINTKVLLIFVSGNTRNNESNNMVTIKQNIINPLKHQNCTVNIAFVTSEQLYYDYEHILGKITHKFISDEPQYSKVCNLLDIIGYDNYDWYIKLRPEIGILETINLDKLNRYSKTAINSRIRHYMGPKINIKYGVSISNEEFVKAQNGDKNLDNWNANDFKYNDIKICAPDDQIYIFHKNIAQQAFQKLNLNSLLNGNLLDNTIFDSIEMYKILIGEAYRQCENFHRFIWMARGIDINIIGLNVIFKNWIYSSDLNIDDNTESIIGYKLPGLTIY
jgi:hypothetical protein